MLDKQRVEQGKPNSTDNCKQVSVFDEKIVTLTQQISFGLNKEGQTGVKKYNVTTRIDFLRIDSVPYRFQGLSPCGSLG